MERRVDEKLNAPADFMATHLPARETQGDLIPPSHFTLGPQPTPGSIPVSQITPGAAPGPPRGTGAVPPWMPPAPSPPADPWLAIALAKQEFLQLRRENQRITQLQRETTAASPPQGQSAPRDRRLEDEWRLDVERMRGETERLRGQVETLRESAARQREEIRDRESAVNRQSRELEELRAELKRSTAELGQSRAELDQRREETERLSRELDRQQGEWERTHRELEGSRQEAQRLQSAAQEQRLQAGEEAGREGVRLRKQLEETHRTHQTELQQLSVGHAAELTGLRQTNADLQNRLSDVTQEVTSLRSRLQQVSAERDGLREQLSQLSGDFQSQSETLQSLRTYIGTLTPERGEEERLSERVQVLERENEALRVTVELLNVRLNSVNDILAIQERELGEEMVSGPVLKGVCKGSRVLRLWREKVFMLLVQLHSKDLQLTADLSSLHRTISSLEQQVEKEKTQASVLQHSLQDRTAQLHLHNVHTKALEQDLSRTVEENERLKQWSQSSSTALQGITETVQRFNVQFEERLSEMDSRLASLGQRLSFATRRLDTVHGLLMRREALRKVQQATKPPEPAVSESCSKGLQAEVLLLTEERDGLALELKRTPELIQHALADLRKQFDSEVGLLTQALSRSREEAQVSEAGRAEALRLSLEHESRERVLQEKLSEAENGRAQQLRAMESQLNTARREHTKAVVALRQFERQAERERQQERDAQRLQSEHTHSQLTELHNTLRAKDKDRNLLLAVVREQGLMSEYKKLRTTVLHTSKALEQQQQQQQQHHHHKPQQHHKQQQQQQHHKPQSEQQQDKNSLLSVLSDLQSLSAAVIDSSGSGEEEEECEEEEGQGDAPSHPAATHM